MACGERAEAYFAAHPGEALDLWQACRWSTGPGLPESGTRCAACDLLEEPDAVLHRGHLVQAGPGGGARRAVGRVAEQPLSGGPELADVGVPRNG
jgi:hypothetical protein